MKYKALFFITLLTLAACTAIVNPLWEWHEERGFAGIGGVVVLENDHIYSFRDAYIYGTGWRTVISEINDQGETVNRWEFEKRNIRNPILIGDKVYFTVYSSEAKVAVFDPNQNSLEAFDLPNIEIPTAEITVGEIQPLGDHVIFSGSIQLVADDTNTRKAAYWITDHNGQLLTFNTFDEAYYLSFKNQLSDGSLIYLAYLTEQTQTETTTSAYIFNFENEYLPPQIIPVDEDYRFSDALDAGYIVKSNTKDAEPGTLTEIELYTWDETLAQHWTVEIPLSNYLNVYALPENSIIFKVGSRMFRVADNGTIEWQLPLWESNITDYTFLFDEERYASILTGDQNQLFITFDQEKVAPFGAVLDNTGATAYVKHTYSTVIREYNFDGELVKEFQQSPYTRIIQATSSCYNFDCQTIAEESSPGTCYSGEIRLYKENLLLSNSLYCLDNAPSFMNNVSVYEY